MSPRRGRQFDFFVGGLNTFFFAVLCAPQPGTLFFYIRTYTYTPMYNFPVFLLLRAAIWLHHCMIYIL